VTALREILAEFGIVFDATALDRADAQLSGTVAELNKLGAAASEQEESIEGIGLQSERVVDVLKTMAAGLAAAFTLQAIKGSLMELTHQADELEKSALALGTSVEQLQQYQHAAGLANVSAEQLRAAFAKLQRAASDAAEGNGASATAFSRLGVSLRDAQGQLRPAGALLDDVADRLGAVENATERNALAMELFGKSGFLLLPLFSEGAEGIKKFRAEVDAFGGGITTDFAARAAELTDQMQRLHLAWMSVKVTLAGQVVPAMAAAVGWVARTTAVIVKWLRQTKAMLAAMTMLVGRGVLALARALPALTGQMLGMSKAGKALLTKWGPMRAALITLARLVWRVVLPFLALDDALTFLTGGDSAIGRALDKLFGPGTARMVQDFVSTSIRELGRMAASYEETANTLEDSTASATSRALAGMLAFMRDAAAGFPLITTGLKGELAEMGLALDTWILETLNKWNAFVAGLRLPGVIQTALSVDTSEQAVDVAAAQNRVAMLREQEDWLRRGGAPVEPSAGQRIGRTVSEEEHLLGQEFGRRVPEEEQQAVPRPRRRLAFDELAAGLAPESLRPTMVEVPTPPAPTVNQAVQQSNHIENHFMVPPGTGAEQQSAIAGAANKGTREGLDVKALRAVLVPTAG
jgi:hypothetical protein